MSMCSCYNLLGFSPKHLKVLKAFETDIDWI